MSGAMQSNVGNPQIYEDGDQRYTPIIEYSFHKDILTLAHRPHGHQLDHAPGGKAAQHGHDIHDPK